jgi:hypothetical protein
MDFESANLDDLTEEITRLKEELNNLTEVVSQLDSPASVEDDTSQALIGGNKKPVLHWIEPVEFQYTCSLIQSLDDAKVAMRMAVTYRDDEDNGKPEVMHGDFLILTCVDETEKSDQDIFNSKMFFGLCVEPDGGFQGDIPAQFTINNMPNNHPSVAEKITATHGHADRFIIAWSTTGGSSVGEFDGWKELEICESGSVSTIYVPYFTENPKP